MYSLFLKDLIFYLIINFRLIINCNPCQQQVLNYFPFFLLIIGEKVRYQKTSEGDFKRLEKNSSIDLVMQKFHYQSKEDKDIKFLAWKIVDTTDKTLKKFVNQALLQKVDQKQQALTKPDDIINYMLDNYDG